MAKIKSVKAREILDSRGNPTVEVDVVLSDKSFGRAAVPSGASTGEFEALELRDISDKRFFGKGVLKAVNNVEKIIFPKIKNKEADFRKIDRLMLELDGTANKSKLGANAILGVSLAVAKATACSKKVPLYYYLGKNKANLLPLPLMNILNGGVHADNNLDIQEFMIAPLGFSSFTKALRAACEVFHSLKAILKSKNLSTSVGDEGGFAPNLNKNEEALELIIEAISKAGYKPAKEVALALDSAASSFFKEGKYLFEGQRVDSDYMIDFYCRIADKYPIVSLEDGLDENDWEGWAKLTNKLGKKIQLVGDDLFVTNTKRLKQGIDKNIANSILIKVNQIGTLTETIEAIDLAAASKYTSVISHRSGETEDVTIAHLAVGKSCGQIKTGSLSRTDRVAKYNELIRIEQELGKLARYGGKTFKYKIS
ncbi:MAG: phosphopyruvate hydratase [Candidatus Omnitrophica bacterium]|jgi:enolase|nr:phosphopyruvate hydratase [Candidatus Omnitrophota bacterium]